MALNPKRSAAAANAALDAWKSYLNTGYLRIYSGTRPATVATALSGNTLLAELRYQATAFGASTNGVATANAISSVTAAATGTATFARCFQTDGTTAVMDLEVGTSGSDVNINSTAISAGATVSCTSHTLTEAM